MLYKFDEENNVPSWSNRGEKTNYMSLYPTYDLSALKPQGREESILYFILKKDVIWCVKIKPLVILLFMYFWFLY